MKTDVLMATYNSGKYLQECLEAVFNSVPVNRLIVADHNSTDNTLPILRSFGAEILSENIGLGYARQIAIDRAKTSIITFIDSDVVFKSENWWHKACSVLMQNDNLGAVCTKIDEDKLETARMKYTKYWYRNVPKSKQFGLTLGSTLIKRDLISDIKIPSVLDAREDRFLELHLLNKGYHITYTFTKGIHYFDYRQDKAAWAGANTRLISGIIHDPDWKQTNIFWILGRRILTATLKGIPPALAYHDANIIIWNTKHWISFLRGWLQPYKYRKHLRMVHN